MLGFSHFYRLNTLILGQFPCFSGIFHIKPFDRPIFLNYPENLHLGMITPPFGINMFYLQGVAPPGVDTKVMYKAVMPYVIIFLVACFFMMLFPELIVIFPNAAMGY